MTMASDGFCGKSCRDMVQDLHEARYRLVRTQVDREVAIRKSAASCDKCAVDSLQGTIISKLSLDHLISNPPLLICRAWTNSSERCGG